MLYVLQIRAKRELIRSAVEKIQCPIIYIVANNRYRTLVVSKKVVEDEQLYICGVHIHYRAVLHGQCVHLLALPYFESSG